MLKLLYVFVRLFSRKVVPVIHTHQLIQEWRVFLPLPILANVLIFVKKKKKFIFLLTILLLIRLIFFYWFHDYSKSFICLINILEVQKRTEINRGTIVCSSFILSSVFTFVVFVYTSFYFSSYSLFTSAI